MTRIFIRFYIPFNIDLNYFLQFLTAENQVSFRSAY